MEKGKHEDSDQTVHVRERQLVNGVKFWVHCKFKKNNKVRGRIQINKFGEDTALTGLFYISALKKVRNAGGSKTSGVEH